MHIKHIHEALENVAKYLCTESGKPKEEIDTHEFGLVADIVKDLACAEKEARIAKSMEEAEEGKDEMYEEYEPYLRRGGRRRDSRGRYMYTEPYMHMQDDRWDAMRDMDYPMGRMYYSDNRSSGMGNMGSGTFHSNSHMDANPGRSSSRYGYSYDNLMEQHKRTDMSDPMQKKEHEKKYKEWQTDLMDSIESVIMNSTPEEKVQLKQSLMKAAGKIQ